MRDLIIKQKQTIAQRNLLPLAGKIEAEIGQDGSEIHFGPRGQIQIEVCEEKEDEQEKKMVRITQFSKKIIDCKHRKILQNVLREKEREPLSLENKPILKSEKLMGKESIIAKQHSQRDAKKSQSKTEVEEEPQKIDEHYSYLMKVNQNIRNMQTQTNAILLRSIEMLRNNEKQYLTSIQSESPPTNRKISETFEMSPSPGRVFGQQGSFCMRNVKEEAALRFKEKIKIKQSRRHIYRTLKNKNDNMNKIKLKTHHNASPQKTHLHSETKECSDLQLLRVHCPEVKQNSYNLRSSNFRSLTKTYYENMRELRVESKHQSASDQPALELRTTKCHFASSENQEQWKNWSKCKKRSGIEVYQDMISKLKNRSIQQGPSVEPGNESSPPHRNMFRELTPWHFEE